VGFYTVIPTKGMCANSALTNKTNSCNIHNGGLPGINTRISTLAVMVWQGYAPWFLYKYPNKDIRVDEARAGMNPGCKILEKFPKIYRAFLRNSQIFCTLSTLREIVKAPLQEIQTAIKLSAQLLGLRIHG